MEGQTGGFGEQEARKESGIASEESSVLSQGPEGGERSRGKWDGARVCGNRLWGHLVVCLVPGDPSEMGNTGGIVAGDEWGARVVTRTSSAADGMSLGLGGSGRGQRGPASARCTLSPPQT